MLPSNDLPLLFSDTFEPVSTTNLQTKNCLFCQMTEAGNYFVAKTPNFFAVLDPSPIVEGHLLIVSNGHYGCAGELPKTLMQELVKLREHIRYLMEKSFQSATFFEHGRAGHCMSLSKSEISCHHFHLHALPAGVRIEKELGESFTAAEQENYASIIENYERYGNYLYFEPTEKEYYFFPAEDASVQSHLLRTLLCEKLGTPERADWEHFVDHSARERAYEIYRKESHG